MDDKPVLMLEFTSVERMHDFVARITESNSDPNVRGLHAVKSNAFDPERRLNRRWHVLRIKEESNESNISG